MKNKRKNIIILLILILLLTLGIGITYAIFKWTSSNSDVTFNVEGCYITYDAGGDITGASLGPALSKDDTDNVLSKKITLSPECSGVTASLTLTVNEIATELKTTSFVWSLYEGDTKVSSGNFADATTDKVYTLLSTKTLTENTTTTYILYIYIDGTVDNDSSMGGKNFKFTLGASGQNALYKEPPTAAEYVAGLDDSGAEDNGVYKVHHDAIASGDSATGSDIKATDDYRYYGESPNNYVCLDMEEQSVCPDRGLYRIIGSIYEENNDKNLLKIMKATNIKDGSDAQNNNLNWDMKTDNSKNIIWSSKTSGVDDGAQIMKTLNGWFNRGTGEFRYWDSKWEIYITYKLNYEKDGLSDKAIDKVNKISKYYLGGNSDNKLKTDEIYLYERGNTTASGGANYWNGTVGLMYPSDYGYASGKNCVEKLTLYNYPDYRPGCATKNWISQIDEYQFTITPMLYEGSTHVYGLQGLNFASISVNDALFKVYPVFYLKSDIYITGGDGSESNPYLLS